RAVILAAGEARKPAADLAVAGNQFALAPLAQLSDGGDTVARQLLLERRADAPDQPHRLGGQEIKSIAAAEHGEAARLVQVGRDLGEKLVVGEADRDGHADLALDAAREQCQGARRRTAMDALRAGEVEKGLVD